MKAWSSGAVFEPKPPPMYSQTTRTRSGSSPSPSASAERTPQMYWVEMCTSSVSPIQRQTDWWVSSELWRTTWVR